MGSHRIPLVLRLLALACTLVALAVPGVVAATAAAEVTTPLTEETPLGEATSEPVVPPVKEVTEKAATPKREGSGEEPAAAPQATTTAPTTTTGEPSASSSTPTATAPAKVPTGSGQSNSSSNHSSGSHEAGTAVHHATGLGGTTPDATATRTAPQSTQGGAAEAAAEPANAGASEVAGVATTSTEVAEAKTPTGPQPQAGAAVHATADPPAAAKLDEAQAVERAPVAKPAPSPSPLQTVGHALSRPFEEPTSKSALLVDLGVLLAALAIGLAFWLELGGGTESAYWYRRRLTGMLDWGRRGRNAG
jgi:DNA polymerase-3 subunit gamma/tau